MKLQLKDYTYSKIKLDSHYIHIYNFTAHIMYMRSSMYVYIYKTYNIFAQLRYFCDLNKLLYVYMAVSLIV